MANDDGGNYPRPLRHLSVYLSGMVQGRLWLKVLVGMASYVATVLVGEAPNLRRQ